MTATRIQDYARRQVRAVDARPHRHHKGPTGDGANRGAEEAGRRHWSAAPNKAQRMPRVLDVEVNHEASQTNGSATPSAFWQIRGYAVVAATGNQVRCEAMAHAITASDAAVILKIERKKRAQRSPSSQKLDTLSPTMR